jgi:OOP family OmpA-OmpF porin
MKKLIFALIAGATAMGAAQAQNTAGRPYVGVGAVSAEHKLAVPGVTTTSDGDRKTSAKIFGGYDIDQNFGVEAGYTDFGKARSNYTIAGVPGSVETKGHAVYVAGKATAPVNEQFGVYGKLGAAYNKAEMSGAPGMNRKDSDTGLYAAVGAQYNISPQTALTLEYERYGEKKEFGPKPDAISLAARFNF